MPVAVRVQDFQSIREALINIDGLTVITGTNNAGKSALLRAVRGVFENTPGTAFVRHGAEKCRIEISFSDGHTVTWEKGDKLKPTYTVDGGSPVHPGRQVPDEVAALKVVPITAGGQEIWPSIAPQFTGQVFLLDKPGSMLAEAVADVERVGHLNRALRVAESGLRSASSELKVRRADIQRYEKALTFFEGLDEAESFIKRVSEQEDYLRKVTLLQQTLNEMRTRLRTARKNLALYQGVEKIKLPDAEAVSATASDLEALRSLKGRHEKARTRVKAFQGFDSISLPVLEETQQALALVKDLRGLQSRRTQALKRVAGLSTLDAFQVPVEGDCLGLATEIASLRDLQKRRKALQVVVQELETEIENDLIGVERGQQELESLVTSASRCPTCGQLKP